MKEPKHKQTNKQKSKKTVRGLIISNLYCRGIYHHYRPQQQQQLFIICTIKLESLCGALQHDWKVSTLEAFRRFQTNEYLTIIGRGWAKYRDLSVASRASYLSSRQPSSIIVLSVNHQVCFLMNICHFHARANTTRRKAWFHLYMSRIFAAKRRWTILCVSRPLFSGSYFQIFRSRDGFSANEN